MNFSQQQPDPAKKLTGIALVFFLHIFVIYALMTGLAGKVVEVIRQPVETMLIQEIKPPPPQAPPPEPAKKVAVQRPVVVPRPQVKHPPPPPENTIAAVIEPPPVPTAPAEVVSMAPASPEPSPPAPASVPVSVPAITDLNACKPEYPRASLRDEETGTVIIQFVIGVDSQLVDAKIKKSSGFQNLDKATLNALTRCKFKAGTRDGVPLQTSFTTAYVWKLEN